MHPNVICYLDELAMCKLSWKAWDELVWPPPSATIWHAMPEQACWLHTGACHGIGTKYAPLTVPHQLPKWIIHLLHKRVNLVGYCLTYDSSTNGAEWIPMHGTKSNLSQVKEMLALALCNMVPGILDEGAERLDRSGEYRDEN